MASERKLKIIIDKAGDADPGISSLTKGLGALGGVAAGVATAGLAVAAAGVVALGAGLFTSVGAAMDAQQGQAELQAVLESTKGVAGMTADSINDLASKFQGLTMFEDDAILAGENMLLTFTNIGADVFPMATEAMLNMGQKFGSIDAAAVQLGKALNDPIAGVTALRKVGVTLTEAQEESIKKFMEVGDIAGAQKIILGELETEFGGLAVAAGNTLAGKLAILKNTFGDIQETIGAAFLPVLMEVADALSSGLKSEAVQSALASLTGFITNNVVPGIKTLLDVFGENGLSGVFELVKAKISDALPAILARLSEWSGQFWNWISGDGGVISQAGPMLTRVIDRIDNFLVGSWPDIKATLTAWSDRFWDWILGPGGAMEKTGAALTQLANNISAWINGAGQPKLVEFGRNAGGFLVDGIELLLKNQEKINRLMLTLVKGLGAGALFAMGAIIQVGTSVASGAIQGIIKKFTGSDVSPAVGKAITDALKRVVVSLNPIALFTPTGRSMMDGIIKGVRNGVNALQNAVMEAARRAFDAAMDWLGASSPSTRFSDEVGEMAIGGGIAQGIERSAGAIAAAARGALKVPTGISLAAMAPAGPSLAGAGAGGGGPLQVIVNLTYSPAVSMADRLEAERVLAPLIAAGVRRELGTRG